MFQLKFKLLCFLLCWLLALVTNPVKTETCQVQFSLTRVFKEKEATLALCYNPTQVACSSGAHTLASLEGEAVISLTVML